MIDYELFHRPKPLTYEHEGREFKVFVEDKKYFVQIFNRGVMTHSITWSSDSLLMKAALCLLNFNRHAWEMKGST